MLVVAAGAIHSARWVTKTDTQAVDTFRSPGHGAIGTVAGSDGQLQRAGRAVAGPLRSISSRRRSIAVPIAIVPSYGDVDPSLVDWHLDRGARGIVIEGSGRGQRQRRAGPWHRARARERDVPVVVTSRCLTGAVAPIYGGPGGGHSIADLDVIRGGELSARKARLALAVGLALAPEVALRDWFASLVG